MTFLRKIFRLLVLALASGCASLPKPDQALVRSSDYPWYEANVEAERISGAAFEIEGTSMYPFLIPGDYVVGDFAARWEDIAPGMVLLYDANWADANIPLVCHMVAERTGDGWIMTGINNAHSENGPRALMRADYRAKVVQVYTFRKKL